MKYKLAKMKKIVNYLSELLQIGIHVKTRDPLLQYPSFGPEGNPQNVRVLSAMNFL
jgi:hypothetical protein